MRRIACFESASRGNLLLPHETDPSIGTQDGDLHGCWIPTASNKARAHHTRKSLRLLVAEDHLVNQAVARRYLKRPFGRDGRQWTRRVEAVTKASFEAEFMDVQMPAMDGFEATAEIRRREQSSGRRVPIFAMTAHAMNGDRQRCLEARDGWAMSRNAYGPKNSARCFRRLKRRSTHGPATGIEGAGPRIPALGNRRRIHGRQVSGMSPATPGTPAHAFPPAVWH